MTSFDRDRFTWLAYGMLSYYAFMQAAPGLLMPFLRDELNLSYTVSGLHFTAFSLGMVISGLITDRLAARWGRRVLFWGGGGGMALGALIFTIAQTPVLTLLGIFMMGSIGSWLLIMVQATLSDHHGEQRTQALTESNIAAVAIASTTPLLVGGLEGSGIGWRGAFVVGALAWGLMATAGWGIPVPAAHARPKEQSHAPLPRAFWVYWLVIFLSVSVEWSMVYWGADFLDENTPLSQVNAATAMTVFFVAMVVGRAAGSYLSRLFPSNSLLLVAGILTMIGFLPFWLSGAAAPSLMGLFIVGLGVANLFPLTLVAASSVVSEEMTDSASGRVTLGSGCAMLIMPQILGSLADLTSIQTAYGVMAVVIALVIAVMVYQVRQPLPKVQEEAELESRVGIV